VRPPALARLYGDYRRCQPECSFPCPYEAAPTPAVVHHPLAFEGNQQRPFPPDGGDRPSAVSDLVKYCTEDLWRRHQFLQGARLSVQGCGALTQAIDRIVFPGGGGVVGGRVGGWGAWWGGAWVLGVGGCWWVGVGGAGGVGGGGGLRGLGFGGGSSPRFEHRAVRSMRCFEITQQECYECRPVLLRLRREHQSG